MNKTDENNSKLSNLWPTFNKIRSKVAKHGLNLWNFFKPLDPNGDKLLSESKFLNVFTNQIKTIIELSDQEICELTDYFCVPDGRILYHQFCEVIHSNGKFITNLIFVRILNFDNEIISFLCVFDS